MGRPLIGVSGPAHLGTTAWYFTRWALRRAGADALRLTPKRIVPRSLDGLVIGGGADLEPTLYGGDPTASFMVDAERDALEWSLLERAVEARLPVLGICRGAQLINVFYGGSLHQDLVGVIEHLVLQRTVLPKRRVHIAPDTRLHELMREDQTRVNSLHRQGVARVGLDLRRCARDDFGVVQAIEHTRHPFLIGVQWHPEYLPQMRPQRRLFAGLVQAANGGAFSRATMTGDSQS